MSKLTMTLLIVGAALAAPAVASAQADKGAQVFAAQKCSMCHAVAGKGNAKGPLDGVGAKYSAADLKEWIVNAKVMMEKTKATRKAA